MSILKTAFRFFNKNLLLNIFITLQLTVAIFLVNSLFILGINLNYTATITKDLFKEDFFVVTNIIDGDNATFSDMEAKYASYIQVGKVDNIGGVSVNGKLTRTLAYSQTIADYIKIPLAKGQWYDKAPTESGYINIVATSDIGAIGDIVEYGDSGSKLKIVGILPQSYPYIRFNNSVYCVDDMFDWNTPSSYTSMIMYDYNALPNFRTPLNAVVVINGEGLGAPPSDIRAQIIADFGISGTLLNAQKLIENGAINNEQNAGIYMPIIIIFLIVAILNFILIIILSVRKNLHDISILYLCGAKKYNILAIMATFSFIICFFAVIITTIITNVVGISFMSKGVVTNNFVTAGIIASVTGMFILLTVAFSQISLKQKDISLCLKSQSE